MFRTITLLLAIILVMGVPVNATSSDQFILPEYSKKISLDFKEAPLSEVLKMFSKQAQRNFIAANDVATKKVTLFMQDVPVEEALTQVLEANDLIYSADESSGIFVVKSKPTKEEKITTRVYGLKYAHVNSSKLNSTISISATGGVAGASGATGAVGGGIMAGIQAVLTQGGKVVEDARTNSLIVTDKEANFPNIEKMIAKLDVPVAQIMIQVEMLDISKSTSDLMGVKFGSTPLQLTGGTKNVLYPWNQNNILRKEDFAFSSGGSSSDTGTPQYTTGKVDASGMTALIQFLRTQNDTRNLARPRILTLNNETAEIKISTNEAIGLTTVTSSATSNSDSQSKQAERVQTGVFLTVTPQANPTTGDIIMAIYPKVIQASLGQSFDGVSFKDPEERGSQSILSIKNGETIVIGGLLRRKDSNEVTKLPILGDIPILGAPFRHKAKSSDERELIIFITPYILDEQAKSRMMDESMGKVQDMKDMMDRVRSVTDALNNSEQGR